MIYFVIYLLSVLISWLIITFATKLDSKIADVKLIWIMLLPVCNIWCAVYEIMSAIEVFIQQDEIQRKILKFLRWM